MDKKVYQLSHEQVNFLANDLVEILQEITKTSEELQELNEKSKNFISDNDVSKLKDLLKEVSFILTSTEAIKDEAVDSFKGVENLFYEMKEHTQKIETLNKKLDKKYSNQFKPVNESSKMPFFFAGVVGFLIAMGIFGLANGFESLTNIFNFMK
jgi:uncharacterized membrane protein